MAHNSKFNKGYICLFLSFTGFIIAFSMTFIFNSNASHLIIAYVFFMISIIVGLLYSLKKKYIFLSISSILLSIFFMLLFFPKIFYNKKSYERIKQKEILQKAYVFFSEYAQCNEGFLPFYGNKDLFKNVFIDKILLENKIYYLGSNLKISNTKDQPIFILENNKVGYAVVLFVDGEINYFPYSRWQRYKKAHHDIDWNNIDKYQVSLENKDKNL